MTLELTPEEIERYAPYHAMPEFGMGFNNYNNGFQINELTLSPVGGQAYDRGAECAMRRARAEGR